MQVAQQPERSRTIIGGSRSGTNLPGWTFGYSNEELVGHPLSKLLPRRTASTIIPGLVNPERPNILNPDPPNPMRPVTCRCWSAGRQAPAGGSRSSIWQRNRGRQD